MARGWAGLMNSENVNVLGTRNNGTALAALMSASFPFEQRSHCALSFREGAREPLLQLRK